MSADIGPGSRLLCVQDWPESGALHPIRSGTIYTCRKYLRIEDILGGGCGIHGPSCQLGAVSLEEFPPVYISLGFSRYEGFYCLGFFRPIGGELPESIARLATPTDAVSKTPVLEPA